MKSHRNSAQELLTYLKMQGPTLSSVLVAHFGLSRQTLSRRVKEMGNSLVTIGKGRATQLAARHTDWPREVQLYQVQTNGQLELFGGLRALQAGTQMQWYLVPQKTQPALMQDEFKNGLFPGWPWFLEDLRPAGFLGRAFGQRMTKLFQIDPNPENWDDLELLNALTCFGTNLQGNFIVGDGLALEDFQNDKLKSARRDYQYTTPEAYPELAKRALDENEDYGSSAGGEQPKFTTLTCDSPAAPPRAVIVKFSPRLDTSAGQRWLDLLHAEHIANQVLREAGFATATTRIFQFEDRVFLESERFDRVDASGRKGLVTLKALDAAYIGRGNGSWSDVAHPLHAGKWISDKDREQMIQLHCFGQLIANTDMHWGNLSFFLPEAHPYPLAPVYDMLPMLFRPSSSGEVVERTFEPKLPKPEDQTAWLDMMPLALTYWQRIAEHPDISPDFKAIATSAAEALKRIHKIVTS